MTIKVLLVNGTALRTLLVLCKGRLLSLCDLHLSRNETSEWPKRHRMGPLTPILILLKLDSWGSQDPDLVPACKARQPHVPQLAKLA